MFANICDKEEWRLTWEGPEKAGADIIGANCGNGPQQMIAITREMRKFTTKPILNHANAGMPQLVDGKTVFKQTPADMAASQALMMDMVERPNCVG